MAVGGYHSLLDSFHMVAEILYLGSVFGRETISCGVGDVQYGGTRLYYGLDDLRQIFVFGAAGVFRVEFHVLDILLGIFHRTDSPFEHLVPIRVELIPDMIVGSPYPGVDSLLLGIFQGLHGHIDILLHRPGEGAYRRPRDGLRYLHHRVEISRAGDGKSGFDYVHSEFFERLRHLNLLYGIQLASGHLFPVA